MMKVSRQLFAALSALALSTFAHAADVSVPAGLAVFNANCAACHQAGGQGMPGLAPALASTLAPMLRAEDGSRYIALVLTQGLSGKIVSAGQTFNGAMPAQSALSDADLAAVANYVARDLNGVAASNFTAEDMARAKGTKVAHKELRDMRARAMP
ncbi:cytochrome c [Variovorax sp. J22R133]|uniref:c-type cytochrome n=1 Tax=Variovorax brevis TaxID=3053503 RepID=UPI002575457D|nr:cytochrome c [Variovorax sp. J22R133]MDM0111442.1 cytochrome c [Variovorax sp. J22R133]